MPTNADVSTERSHVVKKKTGESRTILVRSSCAIVVKPSVSLTNTVMLTRAHAARSPLYPALSMMYKSSVPANVTSSNVLLANTATVLCLVAAAQPNHAADSTRVNPLCARLKIMETVSTLTDIAKGPATRTLTKITAVCLARLHTTCSHRLVKPPVPSDCAQETNGSTRQTAPTCRPFAANTIHVTQASERHRPPAAYPIPPAKAASSPTLTATKRRPTLADTLTNIVTPTHATTPCVVKNPSVPVNMARPPWASPALYMAQNIASHVQTHIIYVKKNVFSPPCATPPNTKPSTKPPRLTVNAQPKPSALQTNLKSNHRPRRPTANARLCLSATLTNMNRSHRQTRPTVNVRL